MNSASIESALQIVSLAFLLILILRLTFSKLIVKYPFFGAMLLVTMALQFVVVLKGASSREFLHSYNRLEPIRDVLFVLVVWELFSGIFRNYAGLRSLSRWIMGIAAVVSSAGLALSVSTIGVAGFSHSRMAARIIRFERGLTFGLVIFVIVMLYFVSRYPIRLPRNNIALCMIYSTLFLGYSAILIMTSYLPHEYGRVENIVIASLESACYIGWALLLSKTGEYQETRVRQHVPPEREKLLIGQLNAMNDVLVRAGRSISHHR
jgi:hypothetical protein